MRTTFAARCAPLLLPDAHHFCCPMRTTFAILLPDAHHHKLDCWGFGIQPPGLCAPRGVSGATGGSARYSRNLPRIGWAFPFDSG